MKQRAWITLMESVRVSTHIPPNAVISWPSHGGLMEYIQALPEYRALRDVGFPDVEPAECRFGPKLEELTHEKLIRWISDRFVEKIVDKWLDRHVHACLSFDDLFQVYVKESGPEENREAGSPYGTPDRVIRRYYGMLMERAVNVLYADKKVYDLEELELLVPTVVSEYYDRDIVIARYLEMVNALKPPEFRAANQLSD